MADCDWYIAPSINILCGRALLHGLTVHPLDLTGIQAPFLLPRLSLPQNIMSGLEILGIAASIIQISDTGLSLAKHIHSYHQSVASADKRLGQLATDVHLASQIVRDIGDLFSQADAKGLVAEPGITTATQCIQECETTFQDIGEFIEKTK
jgi:hypothetical protein